jgi:hypothetical protein
MPMALIGHLKHRHMSLYRLLLQQSVSAMIPSGRRQLVHHCPYDIPYAQTLLNTHSCRTIENITATLDLDHDIIPCCVLPYADSLLPHHLMAAKSEHQSNRTMARAFRIPYSNYKTDAQDRSELCRKTVAKHVDKTTCSLSKAKEAFEALHHGRSLLPGWHLRRAAVCNAWLRNVLRSSVQSHRRHRDLSQEA